MTDPLQHVTHFVHDSVGRVIQTTLPDQRQIQAAYDLDGNLTALTPPSRPEHDFGFDAVNDTVAYTPPALGISNPATTFTYNNDHQLVTVNRPDGQTVTFNYDNAGRLSNIALPQGTVALAYDPAPPGLSTGWTPHRGG